MGKTKICIVGLHKTGTTSIALMLEKFGLLVTGPDTNLFYEHNKGNYDNIDKYLSIYDVFQDDPWYDIFEYIDSKDYDVKFVYLHREEDTWIQSVQKFYGSDRYNCLVRRHFYGNADTLKYPELYIQKFQSHRERVFNYFKDNDNFIVVDISNPEDAIALQKFLGLPVRFKEFPWANKTPKSYKEKQLRKLRLLTKGYFGLNRLTKNVLRRTLGHSKYIEVRSQIRHKRTAFKKWKIQTKNKVFRR